MFMTVVLHGQESVCDLFKDLMAADGRQLIVTGDLIISKDVAALGAADCDYQYRSPIHGAVFQLWPTALHLRPSATVSPKQLKQFRNAAAEADRLRRAGKLVGASASFTGLIRVVPVGDFPAELRFDSIENLNVEALPDASELPVIPICELFQNLPAWKGKRIAVRGESVGTSEGSWIVGSCTGAFYTNGYRWPVSLNYAGPAYYSSEIRRLAEAKRPSSPPKGEELFRGRNNVVRTSTFVGRLRMRSEYVATCRDGGDYIKNGFGHLGGAAAELIVEEVADVELTRPVERADDSDDEQICQPANIAALCSGATTLLRASYLGCVDRTRELLSKEGIDSKNGEGSPSLDTAIALGRDAVVKLLIDAGAPVNPVKFRLWPPLWQAAHDERIDTMKVLLKAGANVDGQNHRGETYLVTSAVFDTPVLKILLEAGANPNALDSDGATALMKASGYGYEDAVTLLIKHGANVNFKDNKGRSALMHAAAGKYVDAIPLLLENGADVYAQDRDGKAALDIARASKNQVAVELLSAAMNGGK
jgi:ankyrin repeat protein